MNTVQALLHFVLLSQVGPGIPGLPALPASAASQLPASAAAETDNRKSYGWKIDEDGELCFIVQVNVEEVQKLASLHQEKFSNMPVELIGRATRICVHVGNDILPREPSLAEIKNMAMQGDSIASIFGPGKLSDVEPPVVMAQDGRPSLPPLNNGPSDLINSMDLNPSAGFPQGTGSGMNLGTNATNGGLGNGNSNAGQDFLGATRNNGELAAVDPNRRLPPTSGKFNSTAGNPNDLSRDVTDPARRQPIRANTPPPTTAAGNPNAQTPSVPSIPLIADRRGSIDPNQYQRNPNFDRQAASTANPSTYGNQTQFPGQNLNDRLAAQAGSSPYAQPSNNYVANNGYPPNGNYPNAQNYQQSQQAPLSPVNPNPNPTLLASNSAGIGTAAQSNKPTAGSTTDISPSDSSTNRTGNSSKPRSQPNQFLQVFFLLSLVVNFYLAVLIRKLLSRYRALLSSVRSQAA